MGYTIVSPNPTSGQDITISSLRTFSKIEKVVLLDVQGRDLKVIDDVESYKFSLSVNDIGSGQYFLRVYTERFHETHKIIIF